MKKYIVVLLAALVSAIVTSAPIKSSIASKETSNVSEASVPTAKDYIQEGLIAMWDGIENAGWRKHNPNATVWVDLIDNTRWYVLNSYAEWHDSYITKSDHSYAGWIGKINKKIPANIYHKECVVLLHKTFGDRAVFWSVEGISVNDNVNALAEIGANKWALSGQKVNKPYIKIESDIILSISGYTTTTIYKNSIQSSLIEKNNVMYGKGLLLGGSTRVDADYSSNFERYGTDGNIYNIRIYDRELSAEEIAYNYAIDKARFKIK